MVTYKVDMVIFLYVGTTVKHRPTPIKDKHGIVNHCVLENKNGNKSIVLYGIPVSNIIVISIRYYINVDPCLIVTGGSLFAPLLTPLYAKLGLVLGKEMSLSTLPIQEPLKMYCLSGIMKYISVYLHIMHDR